MAIFTKKTEKTKKQTAPKKDAAMQVSSGMPNHMQLLLKKPHISEKSMRMSEQDKYVFITPAHITKQEAKKQVEKLYGVNCIQANVINGSTKKRMWRGKKGSTGQFKKIVVTLQKGQKIEITGNS